jgi:hypothetical protein
MATTRIYTVVDKQNPTDIQLVRATRQSTALTWASEQRFSVRMATQNDLEKHLKPGVPVPNASEPPAPQTTLV